MSFAQAFDMLEPVMLALQKIHDQGLIHRDISPSNIMILKNGSVKLLDFGAARDVSGDDEKSLSIMLKPGYAPEEQYRTRGNQGPWTDVYALSATMYKMLTGVTPEDAMSRMYSDDLKRISQLNSSVTASQEKVIFKGMGIDPSGRYQSVEELRKACETCLSASSENNEKTFIEEKSNLEEKTYLEEKKFIDEGTFIEDKLFSEEKTAFDFPEEISAFDNGRADDNSAAEKIAEDYKKATGEKYFDNKDFDNIDLDNKKSGNTENGSIDSGNNSPENTKKPLIPGLIACLVFGVAAAYFVSNLIYEAGRDNTQEGMMLFLSIGIIVFGAASFFSGRLFFGRLDRRDTTPRKEGFIFSVICGILMILVFNLLTLGDGLFYSPITLFLAIMAFLTGRLYFPRLDNSDKKPKIAGLICFIIFAVIAVVGYAFLLIYFEKLDRENINILVVVSLNSVFVSLFCAYFYFSRKPKETKKLFAKILKGAAALVVICFLAKIVVIGVGTVSIGDKRVSINERILVLTPVSLTRGLNLLSDHDIERLKKLKKLERLDIIDCFIDDRDLEVIGELTQLTSLNISGNEDITDLSPLASLTNLTNLNISETSVSDVSVLGQLTQLQYLFMNDLPELDQSTIVIPDSVYQIECSEDGLENINFLEPCISNLKRLTANYNNIHDIEVLRGMADLISLDNIRISLDNNDISDISPLAGVRISNLSMNNNKVEDISCLSGNTKLTDLYLNGNMITDISVLSEFFMLGTLELGHNRIKDISALRECPELKRVNLEDNEISDISVLADLASLKASNYILDLSDNQIEDITPLDGFQATAVDLSRNQIKDVTTLSKSRVLNTLDLTFNNITDPSALFDMPALTTLGLAENPIVKLEGIKNNPNGTLFTLTVSYNADFDWEALAAVKTLRVIVYNASEREEYELRKVYKNAPGTCNFQTLDSPEE